MSRRHRMPDADIEDDQEAVEIRSALRAGIPVPGSDAAYGPVKAPALGEDSSRLAALEARLAGAKISLENKDRQIANLKRKLIDVTDAAISAPVSGVIGVLRDYVRELHEACAREPNPSRKRSLNLQAEAVGQAVAKVRVFLQTTRSETKTIIQEEIDQ